MTAHNSLPDNQNNIDLAADTHIKIAIIGGGLTGLFTATLLERSFSESQKLAAVRMTIFEKSRSVGRLATRYRTDTKTGKNWQWSFGAQFFTAKTTSFNQFITPWINSKLIQPWCAQVINLSSVDEDGQSPQIEPKEQWDTQQARYISTPKMTSWGRQLADELQQTTIQFKTRVAPLAQYSQLKDNSQSADKQTELFDENGTSLGLFDWIICTVPNGQAVELMADSGFTEQAKIIQPEMLACYTLMLGWDSLEVLPETLQQKPQLAAWDVAYVQHSIVDRIFIEHKKPNHSQLLPSVTIHANNEWSQQQVDKDIDEITAQLLAEAKKALNWNEQTAPSQVDCHRWRYASTLMPLDIEGDEQPIGLLVDRNNNWIVSGDWCHKGNIESGYLMAEETVKVVVGAVVNK